MRVSQALVAIGGKAWRIRRDGIDVPISKSFIQVCGKPLLYWNLLALNAADVDSVILCGDHPLQLQEAEILLGEMSNLHFGEVRLFQDPGLGVHGLPYQVFAGKPTWLHSDFIFECGHSFSKPEHYKRIAQDKSSGNVVFSLFESHPANPRQPVVIADDRVFLARSDSVSPHALAHPMVVDISYARQLPRLGFDINRILREYLARRRLRYVASEMPPEFDVPAEMWSSLPKYESYIAAAGLH